ncbi:hypothetical protein CES86_2964 [Brucella lupini]|uniref:Uncharacterized protein n=1 Tax=Brucella lupini TaxID=255457 RepID=A0A256GMN8_9HYPH|nr:hypothetical protein CES86_2964 [Brucella lupini]
MFHRLHPGFRLSVALSVSHRFAGAQPSGNVTAFLRQC